MTPQSRTVSPTFSISFRLCSTACTWCCCFIVVDRDPHRGHCRRNRAGFLVWKDTGSSLEQHTILAMPDISRAVDELVEHNLAMAVGAGPRMSVAATKAGVWTIRAAAWCP